MERKNDPEDSISEIWEATHALQKGHTITLNNATKLEYEVTDINENASKGNTRQISLQSTTDSTKACLTVSNTETKRPMLSWPESEEITLVTQLSPTQDTIISTKSIPNIVPKATKEFNNPESQEGLTVQGDTHVIGVCPDCDSAVIEYTDNASQTPDNNENTEPDLHPRAVCIGCREWCYLDEWRQFNDDREDIQDIDTTQQTLTEAANTLDMDTESETEIRISDEFKS